MTLPESLNRVCDVAHVVFSAQVMFLRREIHQLETSLDFFYCPEVRSQCRVMRWRSSFGAEGLAGLRVVEKSPLEGISGNHPGQASVESTALD